MLTIDFLSMAADLYTTFKGIAVFGVTPVYTAYAILLFIFLPVSSLATYGVLYTVSETLAVEFDTKIQIYLNNRISNGDNIMKPKENTVQSFSLSIATTFTRILKYLRRSKSRVIYKKSSCWKDTGSTLIVKNLPKYDGEDNIFTMLEKTDEVIVNVTLFSQGPVLLTLTDFFCAAVCYLYTLIIAGPDTLNTAITLQILIKIFFILCSPDPLISKLSGFANTSCEAPKIHKKSKSGNPDSFNAS
ncbi:hypothetical protein SK128_011684 [Halocaridina rubra]|uniref:Uncharacterized protein n=1 Tax=Halocaridina rubra TaxID=373956 RepID=A0AAN8WPD1_HALRR